MRIRFILLALAVGALIALPVMGQGVGGGRITGKVMDDKGNVLPGATVSFKSPNLLGERAVTAGAGGNYTSPPLPPGTYSVSFKMANHQPVVRENVNLAAGAQLFVDAEMPTTNLSETVVVTSRATEISESNTASLTIDYEELNALPVSRDLSQAVLLAPGVTNTGPRNNIVINGAQSWESLYLMDGVTLNENIRGQAFTLYIEDAIQETTVSTSAISAEFGRFTGGVVNAVTKSGGNTFDGSLRLSLNNESWTKENYLSPAPLENTTNEIYEGTFGGRIVKDRVWFFLAGRDRDISATNTTNITNIQYPTDDLQDREEGKLTGQITPSHQVQVTYTEINQTQLNSAHGGLTQYVVIPDDGSLSDRELPQELKIGTYTGIVTSNFFIEAQYSEREFAFVGGGGEDMAISTGTPIYDLGSESLIYNESIFCGSCKDEIRANENWRAKGSYFLTTENAGSHDLVFGIDTFTDIRDADNHQSSNDLMVWNWNTTDYGGPTPIPDFSGDGNTWLMLMPILNPSQGTDFETQSVFVNDSWRLNDRMSFNIGVRYDAHDSVNSLGLKVADDSAFSPRLGFTYAKGNNTYRVSAARYTGGVPSGVFNDTSPAGTPAFFGYAYLGPDVTGTPGPAANQAVWDWLFMTGCPSLDLNNVLGTFACDGVGEADALVYLDIPGASTTLDPNLATTNADELTLGYQRNFGDRGVVRVDAVHREWADFFQTRIDLGTGVGTEPNSGATFDLGIIQNDDSDLRREYDALNVMFSWTAGEQKRIRLGGNATWSHARGNFDGETGGSGPIDSSFGSYPEYREASWNIPQGDLLIDQRLRLRGWMIYDILQGTRHNLNMSVLQSFWSGTPYSASQSIDPTSFVTNPGYDTPPTSVTYFFSPRGAFKTPDISRTDLAFNYSLLFAGGDVEIFVQPEVLNLLDNDHAVNVNNSVSVSDDGSGNPTFNPWTQMPVQGVDWDLGSNFGQPLDEDDIQQGQTFRISFGVGFRF